MKKHFIYEKYTIPKKIFVYNQRLIQKQNFKYNLPYFDVILHNKMAKVYDVDIMSKQKVFFKILFLNILISQDDFLGDCVCFIFFKTVRDNWILITTQLSKKSWNLKPPHVPS